MNLRKRSAPLAGLLVGIAAFGGTLVAAPMVVGQTSGSVDGHEFGGEVTAKAPVLVGTDESFGTWQLLTSKTANGDECLDVRLTRFEVGEDDPKDPVTMGSCGGGQHVGVYARSDKQTLVYGEISPEADEVRVTGGPQDVTIKPQKGSDGKSYAFATVADVPSDAQVTQLAGGKPVGRFDGALDPHRVGAELQRLNPDR